MGPKVVFGGSKGSAFGKEFIYSRQGHGVSSAESQMGPDARFYAWAVQLANWGALTRIILSGVLLSKF